jgi:hypothetical protein
MHAYLDRKIEARVSQLQHVVKTVKSTRPAAASAAATFKPTTPHVTLSAYFTSLLKSLMAQSHSMGTPSSSSSSTTAAALVTPAAPAIVWSARPWHNSPTTTATTPVAWWHQEHPSQLDHVANDLSMTPMGAADAPRTLFERLPWPATLHTRRVTEHVLTVCRLPGENPTSQSTPTPNTSAFLPRPVAGPVLSTAVWPWRWPMGARAMTDWLDARREMWEALQELRVRDSLFHSSLSVFLRISRLLRFVFFSFL